MPAAHSGLIFSPKCPEIRVCGALWLTVTHKNAKYDTFCSENVDLDGHPVVASLHEFELSQKFRESFVTEARKNERKVSLLRHESLTKAYSTQPAFAVCSQIKGTITYASTTLSSLDDESGPHDWSSVFEPSRSSSLVGGIGKDTSANATTFICPILLPIPSELDHVTRARARPNPPLPPHARRANTGRKLRAWAVEGREKFVLYN